MTTSNLLIIITNVLVGSKTYQTLSFVDTADFNINENSNLDVIGNLVRLKLSNSYSTRYTLSNSNVPVEFASEALVASTPAARKISLSSLVGDLPPAMLDKLLSPSLAA